MMIVHNLTNKTFGQLAVVNEDLPLNKRRRWNCRCSCGSTLSVLQSSLLRGATVSCGCRKRKLGAENPNWNGHQELTGSQWSLIKNNARNRKIRFNVTPVQAWQKFVDQDRKCALSGVPLVFGASYGRALKHSDREDTTASLDRISSDKGYVIGNIQWVHKKVNLMKNTLAETEFVEFCQKVADNHNKKCPKAS